MNRLSSVNNGKNYYVQDGGTSVLVRAVGAVRPVAAQVSYELRLKIAEENELKKERKPAGTLYRRKYFIELCESQSDIRLFSVGAPVSNLGESSELDLKAVEAEKPKPNRKSKYSLEDLSVDV